VEYRIYLGGEEIGFDISIKEKLEGCSIIGKPCKLTPVDDLNFEG